MSSYTLLYSKIWKQVVAMIAVPVAVIIPFIYVASQYKGLSDALMLILSFAIMGVMILLTLYVVFKQALVPVIITIHESEIEIEFKRKSIFNWLSKKIIPLQQIEFVSDDDDMSAGSRKFFTIKVKGEAGKIILIAPKKAPPEEMEEFSLTLSNAVEQFNQQNAKIAPIRQGSFYTGTFSKILAVTLIAAALIATVIKIAKPSSVEWYRMIWLYVIAASWGVNFYAAQRKNKNR